MLGPKVVAARWLFLCALAFALVGMHHLGLGSCHDCEPLASPAGPAAVSEPATGDSHAPMAITHDSAVAGCCDDHAAGGHHPRSDFLDLLSYCLAILTAGLLLASLLIRWQQGDHAAALARRLAHMVCSRPSRAPPDSGAFLTSLGVLRL